MDKRVLHDLARSGLVPTDMNVELPAPNGFTEAPGYVIPYYTPDGVRHPVMHRVKLFEQREDGAKYTQPPGISYPYFSPKVDWAKAKLSKYKVIVEGEKKAAAAIKHLGIPAIGVGGAYNWQGPENRHLRRPLSPEILEVISPGDTVDIVFDGDFATNRMVENALAELCIALRHEGCTPVVVVLPQQGKSKVGLDDWIVARTPTLAHYKELPRTDGTGLREGQGSLLYRIDIDLGVSGAPHNSIRNLLTAFQATEYYRGRLWFDDFKRVVMTSMGGKLRQIQDSDISALLADIQRRIWPRAATAMVVDLLNHLPTMEGYHRNPLVESLEKLEWDGEYRLKHVFSQVFGAADTPYTTAVGENWFTGCVARAYQPGCKMDTMLILEGREGIGKTTALEVLGGEYYHATGTAMDSKDFLAELEGRWIVDIVELDSFKRAEFTAIKGILTKLEDRFRKAYGRTVDTLPRACVIVGSTNEAQYLVDETGNRRFWPIKCGLHIDTILLKEVAEQLWAEAVVRYKAGELWHIMPIDETLAVQAARASLHPWTGPVEQYISAPMKLRRARYKDGIYTFVTSSELLAYLKVDMAHQTIAMARIVAGILRAYGYDNAFLRMENLVDPPPDTPETTFRCFVKFLGFENEVPKAKVHDINASRQKY